MDGVLHAFFLQFYFCVKHLVGEHKPGSYVNFIPILFGGVFKNLSMPFLNDRRVVQL